MSVSTRGLVFLVAGSMLATSTAAAAAQAVRPASSVSLMGQNLGAANSIQFSCLAPGAAVATPASAPISTPAMSNCTLAGMDAASLTRAATLAASAAASAQPDQTPPPGGSGVGGIGGIGPLPIVLGIITLVVLGAVIIGGGDNKDFDPISPA